MPTFKDPLNQKEIPVKSIYMPQQTLLRGKQFSRRNMYDKAEPVAAAKREAP